MEACGLEALRVLRGRLVLLTLDWLWDLRGQLVLLARGYLQGSLGLRGTAGRPGRPHTRPGRQAGEAAQPARLCRGETAGVQAGVAVVVGTERDSPLPAMGVSWPGPPTRAGLL